MRMLVMGGTLFIGREIVQRLSSRGDDVTVLHRRDHHDLGPGIKNLQADRSDLATLSRVLREERFDAIFDTAYDSPHTSVTEKAQRVLGVSPTSLEPALRAGFSWYEAQPRRQVDYTFEDGLLAVGR